MIFASWFYDRVKSFSTWLYDHHYFDGRKIYLLVSQPRPPRPMLLYIALAQGNESASPARVGSNIVAATIVGFEY